MTLTVAPPWKMATSTSAQSRFRRAQVRLLPKGQRPEQSIARVREPLEIWRDKNLSKPQRGDTELARDRKD
jgi:hypothetical protein